MAITEFFLDGNEYFRITRTWNDRKTKIQRYVRIKNNRRKAYQEAQKIDDMLAERQAAARELKRINGQMFFHATGKVVGINRVFNSNGKYPPKKEHIFSIRYNPRKGKPIRYSTVNIDTHGLRRAYELAIDKLCEFASIPDKSPLKRLMLDSLKYYSFDPTLKINQGKRDPIQNLEQRLKIDFDERGQSFGLGDLSKIENNLKNEIEQHKNKNALHVKRLKQSRAA